MTFPSDPLFYLVAVPAILLTGISKGGFGSAIGGVGVPLMALAISPAQAAAILLPILCLMDLVGLRVYYGKWDRANLRILIPGGMVGIAVGALTFGMFDENSLRLLIGLVAVLFTLNNWIGIASHQAPSGRSVSKGALCSGASGYTSFVAHAGGPPLMIYMLPQRLDNITFGDCQSVLHDCKRGQGGAVRLAGSVFILKSGGQFAAATARSCGCVARCVVAKPG